jgi:hypothetical protein
MAIGEDQKQQQSIAFAVLFIFLALFKGTQKDIPSVKVYYCKKVFQTSNTESEIKSKRKHLSCPFPFFFCLFSLFFLFFLF